ncbi:MAG TPA: 30S ribosomal protein S4e [Candidatus Nanoarchaeia archaeon]|nr:30S ribosomal protein S4e [Candidatus Nanoarchaeia archaeon]
MTRSHLPRYAAPKTWLINRKEHHWIARPRPGSHKLQESITLHHVLKNLLNHATTTKEVKYLLTNNWILVDNKVRKDYKHAVGLMDIIHITKTGEHYRILHDTQARLSPFPIKEQEATLKLLKIINKTKLKKGSIQLNLNDGRNILANTGRVGDTILFDLKQQKILEVIPLEKGTTVYLTAGKHLGELATIQDIIRTTTLEKAKLLLKKGDAEFITLMAYALAVGNHYPLAQATP